MRIRIRNFELIIVMSFCDETCGWTDRRALPITFRLFIYFKNVRTIYMITEEEEI
jgi:hypothetical protein